MLPLYRDPHFTFRFDNDRTVSRFHLDAVEVGRAVAVFGLDSPTGMRPVLIATATVGEGGWVELAGPIVVRAGGGFVAVPEEKT